MPSLSSLVDFINLNRGAFVEGRWDYVGLAQRYPTYEAVAQLVPRKDSSVSNLETTVAYQTETESTGRGAKPGEPITLVTKKKAIRRKVKLVKYIDHLSWVLDTDALLGKPDEHIVKSIQMDFVDFDLHWWNYLEECLLRMADNITPEDDEPAFGFPAWVTDATSISTGEFKLYGGADPYSGGRPGGLSIGTYPKFTNPVYKFGTVSDDDLFDGIEKFLLQRKLMRVVPNPGLLPDTPNDVLYVQLKVHNAITRYLKASNSDVGMDAGRYRGNPTYNGIPIVVWHALSHPDSPVRPTTCQAYLIDWNSFKYSVHRDYDRKISPVMDTPLVPGGKYITSEVWHQITCDRPDRNLKLVSDSPDLQP